MRGGAPITYAPYFRRSSASFGRSVKHLLAALSQQKTPSCGDGVKVEAEGIEPSSQDNPNGSLYMLSPEF